MVCKRGKNYGTKYVGWGRTLSKVVGRAIKRSVEKTERQAARREIKEQRDEVR